MHEHPMDMKTFGCRVKIDLDQLVATAEKALCEMICPESNCCKK
ncbi:hypothetical protein DSOL_1221 [Desulfosporosinus metallidurans]|uniref:Uncharacterized protein n=1 Tax=Desulfosporosinus metallidurans TaxID=1888891 RepID=A0A1Q8QZN5_9FIRM|nr:hypothetical protein DSOL_1221 [Desulfosporosinus metallidurans]